MNRVIFILYYGEALLESTNSQFKAAAFIKDFPDVARVVVLINPKRFYGSHTDFKTDLVTFVVRTLQDLDEISQRKEL